MTEIDYVKMIKQEPEYKAFVKSVLLETIVSSSKSRSILSLIYPFYQMGLTVEQVAKFINDLGRLNEKST